MGPDPILSGLPAGRAGDFRGHALSDRGLALDEGDGYRVEGLEVGLRHAALPEACSEPVVHGPATDGVGGSLVHSGGSGAGHVGKIQRASHTARRPFCAAAVRGTGPRRALSSVVASPLHSAVRP